MAWDFPLPWIHSVLSSELSLPALNGWFESQTMEHLSFCGGDSAPSTERALFNTFLDNLREIYSTISQPSLAVPAWLEKDLISVENPIFGGQPGSGTVGTGRNEDPFIFRALIWGGFPIFPHTSLQLGWSSENICQHGYTGAL